MPTESVIPIPSQVTARRFAARLALFYSALFGLIGTHLPFFPVWLKAIDIDASWIGLIMAAPAVTRFTILPVVTGLAEKRQSIRGACVWTPMVPLTDAYALRGVARYGLNYGPLRLWGSAAFVVGALVCGLLVDVIAVRHLIWVIAAVAGLGALAAIALQPLDNPRPAPAASHRAAALLADPGFLAVIMAAALIQGSHAAYYTTPSPPSAGRVRVLADLRLPGCGCLGCSPRSWCLRCHRDLRCSLGCW